MGSLRVTSAPDSRCSTSMWSSSRLARRHRDRVPEVVGVVALVVVADAGVGADDRGGLVDAVGIDLARPRAPSRSRARGCRRSPRAGAARRAPSPWRPRSRTSASVMPRRSPSTANGRGSRGKSHCTALSSSRSSVFELVVARALRSWSCLHRRASPASAGNSAGRRGRRRLGCGEVGAGRRTAGR